MEKISSRAQGRQDNESVNFSARIQNVTCGETQQSHVAVPPWLLLPQQPLQTSTRGRSHLITTFPTEFKPVTMLLDEDPATVSVSVSP